MDASGVFGEFQRRLRGFVARRVRNPADVEDIVQEAFLRIHRNLGRLRNRDRLGPWVFQIARSALFDHLRHRRLATGGLGNEREETTTEPAHAAGGGSDGDLETLTSCLSPMIAALPPPDRQAIELVEIEGLTQREASTRGRVTPSGMKSRVQRARRKLKAMLLECCRIELDRRGGVIDHRPRTAGCEPCRAHEEAA